MRKLGLVCLGALLAGCGGPTAEWVAQLRAKDSAVRLRAVKVLGERRGEADVVVPALSAALADPDPFVRREAARALGKFGSAARPALPALRRLVNDPKRDVRRAAAAAVTQIDPGAAAPPATR
jgi:HEAT repeat protein